MILAVDKKVAGVAAASDPIKANAKIAILRMKEMGLEIAMITGDNKKTAETIGKELGIDRIFLKYYRRTKHPMLRSYNLRVSLPLWSVTGKMTLRLWLKQI